MSIPILPALRCEAQANLRLALPIIATQMTFMGMSTVDTIFAGRLGADALAAVAVGANVWFLAFIVFSGMLMACSPIVAQHIGAGRPAVQTGSFVRGVLLLALGMGLLWMLAMRLATPGVLTVLALPPPVADDARDYLMALSWATVPFALCFVARNVAEGHGLVHTALVAGSFGFTVNAVFDYLLMYGRLGLPALGPEGCAWASVLGGWSMVAVYAVLYRRLPRLRALELFRPGWPRLGPETWEVLRLGGPIALIVAAEAWMFNVGALLMARFGADVIAAHQIAINVASLAFMVPLSIGFATTVRVGYAAGAGDGAAVRLRGETGMLLGIGFSLLSATLMALLSDAIVALYTESSAVAAVAVRFLYFAALFQFFDCVQATANGALRGIKDTRVPAWITITAYWAIGMPVALTLSLATAQGPYGVWWGFIVALAAASAGLAWRFLHKTARTGASARDRLAGDPGMLQNQRGAEQRVSR
ncbi:multidrug resistance protein, MATE family [Fontimonas thermophila]|uniref:Multidrug-efflux transporter n=1 Tax=Fontimonas thermophila TaxID=1076937 RepID=A0A1I2J140_9GAMM|nr:MATE family efflux transporter [Fontimonas thermophila]SFF48159.1 multidrug resistance protein, MATE family [Fontimonas thermophila]